MLSLNNIYELTNLPR